MSEGGGFAPGRERRAFFALAALLACSGASGLVFEVLWVKYLSLAIGQTTAAVSLVVAAFLSGLVFGSLALGRWADAVRRPLRLYAGLEIATGLSALSVTLTLERLPDLLGRVGLLGGGPLPLRVALAFALVLPPTFAMGGTLPAAVRFATRSLSGLGRSFGTLYSLNTLGAAAGCAAAGFVLIGHWGLFRTAELASAANVAIGLLALALDRAAGAAGPIAAGGSSGASLALPPRSARLLLAAFAAAGFASIAYEVLWFRVLASSLDSSAYAFALLLSTYLLGLVLGGLLYAWRFARHPRPIELFVSAEALIALTGLLSLGVLGQHRLLAILVPAAMARLGSGAGYAAMSVEAALVLIVPTTLIGLAFPLVAQLTASHLERVGQHVGLVYSANTLGGILGSLATGLVLIPALGTQRSFALACAISMGVALLASRAVPGGRRAQRDLWLTAGILAAGLALLPRDYLVRSEAQFDDARLVEVREGRDGTLAVLEYDRDSVCRSGIYSCGAQCPGFRHRQLLFGSISYASTVMPAKRYMRALAHLPMLMHDDPERVLEICFGTGTTAGAFAAHPLLKRLSVVDLNPDVFTMARHFEDANHKVLSDARVQRVVDDGRHFLSAGGEKFDVISLEPPPPTAEGASSLYSRDFYALARSRMAQGAVLAQWIPLDAQDDALARMLLRSMADAFPEVQLWIPSRLYAVALASDRPLRIDLPRWRQRWAAPAVRESLREVGYDRPEELAGALFMGNAGVHRYVQGVAPVTDDRPAIEYFLSTPDRDFDAGALLQSSEDPASFVAGASPDELLRIEGSALAHRHLVRAHALGRAGEPGRAYDEVVAASDAAGDSPYTEFLEQLEYGCLVKRAR